ncbi:Uma2 family endonuclease [Desulfobacterales bacterium HSG17]|nr:Uma2 family endonuclease [Desulfobacterales bacterium HSG17]
MKWQQLCNNSNFNDLPYKIELNEQGQIIMSPSRLMQGAYQSEVVKKLAELLTDGQIITECAIQTPKGTKVADVAWFSYARWQQVKDEFESLFAPEICIEILSPSNSDYEMNMKKKLYFSGGAKEVWICKEDGTMNFYIPKGEIENSGIVPEFSKQIM